MMVKVVEVPVRVGVEEAWPKFAVAVMVKVVPTVAVLSTETCPTAFTVATEVSLLAQET